jgi:predicted flavoprotein YhiN
MNSPRLLCCTPPTVKRRYCDLAGVSAEVAVSTNNHSFRDKMLFTHRGLSGPAILQISSYWNAGRSIRIDLAPGRDIAAAIREAAARNMAAVRCAFQGFLPHRFATRWVDLHTPIAWNNQALAAFDRQTHEWVLVPEGTEGYEKAEVTAGGVDTDELSSKTMESRKYPGCFLSVKLSMSPATLVVITSNGLGHRVLLRGMLYDLGIR